jgi:outer membrane protein OmpA-like peptidoglycan-associated protein
VAPAPPPPNIPPSPVRTTAAAPARTQTAALAAPQPQHPLEVRQLAEVAFAGGSADISSDARGQLSAVALFQQKAGGAIRIVGHAEPQPGKDALQQQIDGFALALDRAKAVAKVLGDAGVPPQAMMVEAAPTRAGDTPHAEIFITN